MRILQLLALLLALTGTVHAQEPAFRVFTAHGTPASLEDIASALDTVDVLFIGENHGDSLGHVIERMLLEAAFARRGEAVTLSLEMFDRDVQPVVDEYLEGLITEEHFLQSSRPWSNYADYRPLVEFARAHGLPLLAANAPRRYVNRVSRLGAEALSDLSTGARRHLAPLPHPPPSEAYRARWRRVMTGSAVPVPDTSATPTPNEHAPHGAMPSMANLLAAQALWDATMAHSIARHFFLQPDALIVHLVGSFHVEEGVGLPDVLRRYRPGTRDLVVVIRPAADYDPAQHAGLGDFVVVTGETE